jgi:hypothetical protein
VNQTFDAKSNPDLSAVWTWYEFQLQLIASERRRFRLVFRGQMARRELDVGLGARFLGSNESEVDQSFQNQRMELELLTMLVLLTTAEAILRIDFRKRVQKRLKDTLSRKYREIWRTRKDQVRLDLDLLEALKEEVAQLSVVSDFRAALRLRNWLAHGRHWHPKLGRNYSPGLVFDISRAVVNALP